MDGLDAELASEICRFMEKVREQKLEKTPGIAETLDWARALVALHREHLDPQTVEDTLGVVFKDWSDVSHMRQSLEEFLAAVGVRAKPAPGAE